MRRLAPGCAVRHRGSLAATALGSLTRATAPAKVPATTPRLLARARIFDGQSAKLLQGRDVLVAGERIEALVPRGHGVKIALGTDILFSPDRTWTEGRQLAKFARFMPAAEVLTRATSGNAELLALSGQRSPYPDPLGVIAAGAQADLLVLDADPLADIEIIGDPFGPADLKVLEGLNDQGLTFSLPSYPLAAGPEAPVPNETAVLSASETTGASTSHRSPGQTSR